MKDRPILFSGPMVRAILDGRKTQTRRVVKNAHVITCDDRVGVTDTPCPYGVPGDRLWVKETWRPFWHPELYCSVQYAADSVYRKPEISDERRGFRFADLCEHSGDNAEPWHPSIHMWREMSRITLEVVRVRVERVEDITEADAVAEGAERNVVEGSEADWEPEWGYRRRCVHYPDGCECFPHATAREWFLDLFYGINKRAPKGSNPWVWVIEFKRVEQKGGG